VVRCGVILLPKHRDTRTRLRISFHPDYSIASSAGGKMRRAPSPEASGHSDTSPKYIHPDYSIASSAGGMMRRAPSPEASGHADASPDEGSQR